MKLVKSCFSDSEDQESSFQHCGVPVRLVQACLCAGETCNAVLNSEEVL